MKVLDFPLIKINIFFVIGILTAYYLKPSVVITISALTVAIVLFILLYFLTKNNKEANSYFSINTYLTAYLVGAITLLFHTDSLQESNYIHCQKAFEKPQSITFILREKLKSNTYNDRYIALVKAIGNKSYSGKIILNIQKDSTKNELITGNTIRVKTVLQSHAIIKNPNQFDYEKYLSDKSIYAQIYSEKSEIEISKTLQKDIWYYTAKLHTRIIRNLEKNHFNPTEMNVALALILGQRQEISTAIIKDYQYSGATHILSVSGLHVGFIMLLITFVLKPVPNNKKGSLLKLIIIISSLITFAILSGLSPSVLRSVVMFSFLAIGNHLHRSKNIFHTLFVSMFLILLFEPYFLFDVGFQLSYLALFFILWLQPLLKEIWSPENRFLLYLWNTLTVSFAAQIGTLPLCLYYFHQFPGLFFITNIIILPLLSFIMFVGIVVVILAIFDANPAFLIQIFEKSIYFLNQTIHFVASFESFVIRNISFHFYYLIAFYLLIITTIIWLKKPAYNKLIAVFVSIIILQIAFIFNQKAIDQKQEFIVFNQKKKTILSERIGLKVVFITNNKLEERLQNNIINPYLIGNSATATSIKKLKNTLFFNGKKIYIMDSLGIYPKQIQPDILLLTQSPQVNLERVLEDIHPKIIIADASNYYSNLKYWKATCMKKNIPFHATSEKGYYKCN
jgi:competence protein ComEC